ncbi:MAG: hypothetical protein AAFR21_01780 [Pseudomonadota bacterium]
MKRASICLTQLLLASLIVVGCTTAGSTSKSGAAPGAARSASEGIILSGIDQSALPKGKCGMILWTVDEARPKSIFRFISGDDAEVGLNGSLVQLPLIEASGANSYGVSEWQAFVSDRGVRIDVKVKFGIGFEGGSYLQEGIISVEDPTGWRTVAPAAGIAGCRT